MIRKDIIDILLEELKTKKGTIRLNNKMLEEAILPISPFLMFNSFKQSFFNKLNRNGLISKLKGTGDTILKTLSNLKARGEIAAEKAKATFGGTSGEGSSRVSYKFTKEQFDFLGYINLKYGPKFAKEIVDFRNEVLAPYEVLKRNIKENFRLVPKDVLGMTRREFQSAVESGRKKIEKIGQFYSGKGFDELKKKISNFEKRKNELEKKLKDFQQNKVYDYDLLNAARQLYFQKREASPETHYSNNILQKVYDYERLLQSNLKTYRRALDKPRRGTDIENIRKLEVQTAEQLKNIDQGKFEISDSDETGIIKYIQAVNSTLKKEYDSYKEKRLALQKKSKDEELEKTYEKLVKQKIKELESGIDERRKSLIDTSLAIKLNDIEKKIWQPKALIGNEYSGNINDWNQKIKIEDFDNITVKYYQKTPAIIKAEKIIISKIKEFETKLKKVLSDEDYDKLIKLKLVNHILTIKEIKSSGDMFDSSSSIEDKVEDLPSKEEIIERLKEIATMEFDSLKEFQDAKKEAKAFVDRLELEDKKDWLNDIKPIVEKIMKRQSLKKQKIDIVAASSGDAIDINQIETLANNIINKEYKEIDDLKQDLMRLDRYISKYKDQDPDEADRNIAEIQFLIDRAKRKSTTEISFKKKEEYDVSDEDGEDDE